MLDGGRIVDLATAVGPFTCADPELVRRARLPLPESGRDAGGDRAGVTGRGVAGVERGFSLGDKRELMSIVAAFILLHF